jgi:hypothetical protein
VEQSDGSISEDGRGVNRMLDTKSKERGKEHGLHPAPGHARESLERVAMPTQTVEPMAMRPRDAAKALGISPRTLWGLTAPRGPIPCCRIGHGKRQSVLYPVAELQAWLTRQAAEGRTAQ